ncbi:MAG: serine/threonine protein kinase, partial [Gemmatimonadaceae bacterium]|nr:serine/threonine protein kinase [Gemmatimonadaceae bacterium]
DLAPPADELIGRTIGAYRIDRVLGRGGMGVVYAGEHVDPTIKKSVAIKTLALGAASPQLAWRFAREREILARLTHPNIAALYDGGMTTDGRQYLVMEYVDGHRIDSWCDERQLSVAQRIDVFRQVCAAVQFAHSNLIVHRDLKPGNIFVTNDGTVKLLDFGIAKLLTVRDDVQSAAEHTQTGYSPFTAAFASPEQLRGEEVTTASDVYSLSVVLYRLLTGTSPYAVDGMTPLAARDVLSSTPVRTPSESITQTQPAQCRSASVRTLRDELRGELDAILMMALRPDPARRYSSVEALSDDLLRYLKGLPVVARPDTVSYRVRKFVQRQRALVLTVSVAAVALMASTAWSLMASRRAQVEAVRTQRVAAVLTEIIGAGTTSRSRYTSVPTLLTVVDSARVSVAREFADEPEVRAHFYGIFAQSYNTLGRPDLALIMSDAALAITRVALGPNSVELALSIGYSADALDLLGRPDSALARRREAVEVLRRVRPLPDSILVPAEMLVAGAMIASMIEEDKALPMMEGAIARERRAARPRWPLIARAEAQAILPTGRQRGDAAADSAFRRAGDALARDTTPADEAMYALAFMVQSQLARGRAAQAVEPAQILVTRTKQKHGSTHILVGQAQNLLAGAYAQLNRLHEARETIDSAITLTRSYRESDPMYLISMYGSRAGVEIRERDTLAVARSLAEIDQLLPKLGAQRPIAEMGVAQILATRDTELGRFASARAHLVRAVQIGRAGIGPTATRTTAAEAKLKAFDAAHPAR